MVTCYSVKSLEKKCKFVKVTTNYVASKECSGNRGRLAEFDE